MNDPKNPKDALASVKIPMNLWPVTATAVGSLGILNGRLKYGQANYRATEVRASVYIGAAMRHLALWSEGQEEDPIEKVPHLSGALASLAIIVDARAHGTLVDDRPVASGGFERLMKELEAVVVHLQELHKDRQPLHHTRDVYQEIDKVYWHHLDQEEQKPADDPTPDTVSTEVAISAEVISGGCSGTGCACACACKEPTREDLTSEDLLLLHWDSLPEGSTAPVKKPRKPRKKHIAGTIKMHAPGAVLIVDGSSGKVLHVESTESVEAAVAYMNCRRINLRDLRAAIQVRRLEPVQVLYKDNQWVNSALANITYWDSAGVKHELHNMLPAGPKPLETSEGWLVPASS